jgi:hypothetical protein
MCSTFRAICLVLFLCFLTEVQGDCKQCFNNPYPKRNRLIKDHLEQQLQTKDKKYIYTSIDSIQKIIDRFKNEAQKSNDKIATAFADVILFSHKLRLKSISNTAAEAEFDKLRKVVKAVNAPFAHGTLLYNYSFHLLSLGKKVDFLLLQQECFNIYKDLNTEEFPTKKYAIYTLANGHYNIDNFSTSINLARFCEKIENDILGTDIFNNHLLGRIYLEKKLYDSALYYFNKNLTYSKLKKRNEWIIISAGYSGLTGLKSRQDIENNGKIRIQEAFEYAIKNQLSSVAIEMGTSLAWELIKENKIKRVDSLIKGILGLSLSGVSAKSMFDFYFMCYQFQQGNQHFYNGINYTDSLLFYQKKHLEARHLNLSNYLNLLLEQQKLKAIESEAKSEKTITNLKITLMGLFFVIVITVIVSFVKKRELALKAKMEKTLQFHSQLEHELNESKKQLKTFIDKQMSKSKILETFLTEFENEHSEDITPELLKKFRSLTILTEEDWKKFQELFDQNYPGVLYTLEKSLPDLTPAELRYIALRKLNLNTKDMARMLGVGENAIRSVKSRLLKKLPSNPDLLKSD